MKLLVVYSSILFSPTFQQPKKLIAICGGIGNSTQLLHNSLAAHPEHRMLAKVFSQKPEARVLETIADKFFDLRVFHTRSGIYREKNRLSPKAIQLQSLGMMSGLIWTLLCLFLSSLSLFSRAREESIKDKIKRNRDIASFGATKSLLDSLNLRAGPKNRLAKTFGITNSFTTTKEIVHKKFLQSAVNIIKRVDTAGWATI